MCVVGHAYVCIPGIACVPFLDKPGIDCIYYIVVLGAIGSLANF